MPLERKRSPRYSFCILLIMLLASSVAAQGDAFDSLRTDHAVLQPDSSSVLEADSLQVLTPPKNSQIDGPVKYWAENISFSIREQTTYLEGNSRIEYQTMSLTAGKIGINWQENKLWAEGIVDSTDSLGNPVFRDLPVLSERGEEPINGHRLEYNFKTRRGRVRQGATVMNPGYYKGKHVHKVGKETLLIEDGYFTTCDLDTNPHFYFRSSKMRVQLKKTAIAKPIVFYIADVPLMAAPFGVFSLRRGRRSGIILPTYGESSYGGRFLKDFGYYFAPSDYWDATLQSTFYERTGFLYRGNLRYNKRYSFSGNVNGSYAPKDVTTGERRERWNFDMRHSQTIGQTLSISASGRFQSDKDFRKNFYNDFEQQIDQQLNSSLVVRKTLPGSRSLTLNARRTENLQTGDVSFDFPDVRYTQPSKNLFGEPESSSKSSWYHNIRYTYGSNLKATGSRTEETTTTTIENPVADEFARLPFGTTTSTDVIEDFNGAWKHDLGASFNTKILKYLKINNSINLTELWVPEYQDYSYDPETDEVIADTVEEFRARHTYSAGVSGNTTLYGLWEVPFSPLKIIRHMMDPSIGFSYSPDFTDERYGYYETFTDTAGSEIQRDRFSGNLFGGTPSGGSRSITMNLRNNFEGKLLRNGEEKKIELFRVNMDTRYNLAKDSLRWQDIRTTLNAKPHSNLTISMGATHTLYKENASGQSIDEFVWADGFQLPSLENWNIRVNSGFSLSAPRPDDILEEDTTAIDTSLDLGADIFNNEAERRDQDVFEGFNSSWKIDADLAFSYQRDANNNVTWLLDSPIRASLQLSKKWKINYRARLDLKDREIVSQQFTINRDLHCWTMNFTWSPNPHGFSYYRLEIRVKESTLRDLKLTKTAGGNRPF